MSDLLPDFLIIGTQKGGTNSLYYSLLQHPQILPAREKEVHFFDLNFDRGIDWYQEQFLRPSETQTLNQNGQMITGEGSPYYIFHPLVPQRVKESCPNVKIIVLLRDPVERTISHYHHAVSWGYETLPLEEALAQEEQRLKGEAERIINDPNYHSFNYQHLSYLARSRYGEQLSLWRSLFPPEQFFILQSEAFYGNPSATVKEIFRFLGLPAYEFSEYPKHNIGRYSLPPLEITQKLRDYFQPYNQSLREFLEEKLNNPWSHALPYWLDDRTLERQQQQWQPLQTQLHSLARENEALKQTNIWLNRDINLKESKINELKQEITTMKTSKFWKLRTIWLKLKILFRRKREQMQ